jgi:hypothetical protein
MNFQSMQSMENYKMVVDLPKFFPIYGLCKVCVLGKNHLKLFDSVKSWGAQNLLESGSQ